MPEYTEIGTVIDCQGDQLVGVLTSPSEPSRTGVVILVGGPQYRVGAHRQFVLLARAIAQSGFAALRFDYRGMGDSDGSFSDFANVNLDIEAAIEHLKREVPSVENIVLWGLCDAASAALIHAGLRADITGVVLLNPWVHSGEYAPSVKISHYYLPMLKGRGAWRKFIGSGVRPFSVAREAVADFWHWCLDRLPWRSGGGSREQFVHQMLSGLQGSRVNALFILAERDLTANEFRRLCEEDDAWAAALRSDNVTSHVVKDADHTFSSHDWRDEVESLTTRWIAQIQR